MNDRTIGARLGSFLVLAAASLASAACSSGPSSGSSSSGKPPFPADADPAAAYCLVYVPPVYRDVPCLVPCRDGRVCKESVKAEKVVFEEVCEPGCYEDRKVPDRCRKTAIVEACPARDEWRPVSCGGGCSAPNGDCWKRVVVPPRYQICEATETEKGFTYCAFTPPQYGVVARTTTVDEPRYHYDPAEYRVEWKKELFTPGHYEWQRRYDCTDPGPFGATRR